MKDEQELGKAIARLLDDSTGTTIRQSTLYRLQSARRAALDNCQFDSEVMSTGNGISVYGRYRRQNAGKLLLLITVVFVLIHIGYSQFLDNDRYALIDTMILADDLPVDAYIDNEFEEWLDID